MSVITPTVLQTWHVYHQRYLIIAADSVGKQTTCHHAYLQYVQGDHKVFPWLQTFTTRKLLYVEYKCIYSDTSANEDN